MALACPAHDAEILFAKAFNDDLLSALRCSEGEHLPGLADGLVPLESFSRALADAADLHGCAAGVRHDPSPSTRLEIRELERKRRISV